MRYWDLVGRCYDFTCNKTTLTSSQNFEVLLKSMVSTVESAVFAFHFHTNPITPCPPLAVSHTNFVPGPANYSKRSWKLRAVIADNSSWTQNQTDGGQGFVDKKIPRKHNKRVFFLDVNPLCYNGSTPSLQSFAHWLSLFFSQVSLTDPVIAVVDGERGNEYRRQLLPSYKAHRRKFSQPLSALPVFSKSPVTKDQLIADVLRKCSVPVIKIEAHEADDVVATLVGQVLERGCRVVIASPDKDFKQLISEDVQIVMPMPDLERWSFYTLKHYMAQYNCYPSSDLSLRSIMGDEVDGVPGIQHVVPGFGRKTAIKLLKKHGSLENLLNAAAVRTVGKQYAQEALTNYADYLRKNYEVLALRRDVDVQLQDGWLSKRDMNNDAESLSNFIRLVAHGGQNCLESKPAK